MGRNKKCISGKWDSILKANKVRTEDSYLRDSEVSLNREERCKRRLELEYRALGPG